MSRDPGDFEVRYRWLSIAVVTLLGVAFTLGLVLYVMDQGSASALRALQGGLLLLMASPAVRMLVATAERIRRRDWTFLVMTGIVALELGFVLWRATTK